jgi:hypothetical protein
VRHIFSGEVGFRPAPRIGEGRSRLGQQEILKCNLPTNKAVGFSPIDCSQIWTSPGGAVAGFPNCVQAAGKWTHPDCVSGAPPGAPAPAPMTGPEILVCPQPDGKWTVLNYPDGEFIKRDVLESEFRTITDNHITYLPQEWACQDPRCAPYCGEAAAPEPAPAPTPEPEPTPTSAPAPTPSPAPAPAPRPIPTLPGGGPLPGLPIGPIPTVPMPRLPLPAPLPRTAAQQVPIPVPCGAKLPTYIRSLRTVTSPTSMSDWSESWMPWT